MKSTLTKSRFYIRYQQDDVFSAEKFPFWHVEAITQSTGQKLEVFAMHYCEGSVELTALNPYEH